MLILLTLQNIDIVELHSLQTGLNGVEDVLGTRFNAWIRSYIYYVPFVSIHVGL